MGTKEKKLNAFGAFVMHGTEPIVIVLIDIIILYVKANIHYCPIVALNTLSACS